MYSFLFQLAVVSCFHLLESWSCLYDKLLSALMGFDFNNGLCIMMEWLTPHESLVLSGGFSLGVLQHLTWYDRSILFSSLFFFISFLFLVVDI